MNRGAHQPKISQAEWQRLSHLKGRNQAWQKSYLPSHSSHSSFWNFKSHFFCGFAPAALLQIFLSRGEIKVYPSILRSQQRTNVRFHQGLHWEPMSVLDLQNVVEGFLEEHG